MHITFTPIRLDAELSVRVSGPVLILNGTSFDFGALPPAAALPRAAIASDWIAGEVTRGADGTLTVPLILPHGEHAPEAVRFPRAVTLTDGPCTAPGLVEGPGAVSAGVIDWDQLVTPETAEAEARATWRAERVVSKLDLVLALASAGLISQQSAIAAAGGAIPAEFEPLIAAMPIQPQTELRIRWAGTQSIPRLSPFILLVQGAIGLSDEDLDALLGWV